MFNSIQTRLMLALIPIVMFFIALAALVSTETQKTAGEIVETVRKNTLATGQLEDIAILAQQIRRYEKEFFIYADSPEGRAKYTKEWTETDLKLSRAINALNDNAKAIYTPSDIEAAKKWALAQAFYAEEMGKIFNAVGTRAQEIKAYVAPTPAARIAADKVGSPLPAEPMMFASTEINDMIKAGKDRFSSELIKPVAEMSSHKRNETLALPEISRSGFERLAQFVIVLCALGGLLALAVMFFLPRTIQRPLNALSAQIDALSKGKEPEESSALKLKEFACLNEAVTRLARAQKMMLERIKRG